MVELPSGTVTLLFTDIEGSTRHVQELGSERYDQVLVAHREVLRAAFLAHRGVEIECRADEFFVSFAEATDALAAVVAAQRSLLSKRSPVRVRMGLHTGMPTLSAGNYVGLDVNRAARICSAGHGGQILVSATTEAALAGSVHCHDLGRYQLHGVAEPERIFEVRTPDLLCGFLALRAEPAETPRTAQRRGRTPTPGEAAWRIRAALEPGPLQQPLSELAAALFEADRELHQADLLIERLDRRRLETQLAAQRSAASANDHAVNRVEQLRGKLELIDRLVEERRALIDTSADAVGIADGHPTTDAVRRLCDRVEAAATALAAVTAANARAHDPLSYRLARTRWRGIYRLEGLYVVPYEDHLGVDRQREFAEARDAREFRDALKLVNEAKTLISEQGSDTYPQITGGGW
jgi:class 3 adenylate cyclase